MTFYFNLLGSTGRDDIDGSFCIGDWEWKKILSATHHRNGLMACLCLGFCIYSVLSEQLAWNTQCLASMGFGSGICPETDAAVSLVVDHSHCRGSEGLNAKGRWKFGFQ